MEKEKTTAKLNETKATGKTAETKAPVKAVETKVAAKVEETKKAVEAKVEETKTAAKEVEAKVAVKAEETKEAVRENVKKRKPRTKTVKKAEKEELKPEIFVQYQGNEAVLAEVVEKAKGEFVAAGHRVSSIKSLQVYLKPEEFAAYYVINQKFAGRVNLF